MIRSVILRIPICTKFVITYTRSSCKEVFYKTENINLYIKVYYMVYLFRTYFEFLSFFFLSSSFPFMIHDILLNTL